MNVPTHEEHLTTADLAGMARGETATPDQTGGVSQKHGPLFPEDVASDFRSEWKQIQTGFVDEPRAAVQRADELVAHAIKRLAESFAEERNRLEQRWDRGDQVNTEDLRLALQTYRSFFHRLLAV
jgi:hypothetical protein